MLSLVRMNGKLVRIKTVRYRKRRVIPVRIGLDVLDVAKAVFQATGDIPTK